MGVMKFTSPRAQMRKESILNLLSDKKPRLIREIGKELFMDEKTAAGYVHLLHSNGHIHIGDWYNSVVPIYVGGRGKDAKQPVYRTKNEREREYTARRMRDPERHMKYLQKRRARKIKPRRDFAASWFAMKEAT
jgi:hypothetical protein